MPASEIIYVLVVLLGIAMLVTGICRNLPVPFTVILVLIGMLLGKLSQNFDFMAPLQDFNLSPEIMLFIFLPALIFESGFALDARQMLKDLPPILMLAIPAMLMSTFVVGLGIWWALDIKLVVALVFGALISATDPVAVVALFKELGAPNRLNVLVEGESLLNDATAIVAFSILLGIAVEGGGIGWSDADNILLEFVRVFIGGALFGAFLGFVACELLYRMQSSIAVILTSSIITAYASFVIAEHSFHVSGVMAVVGSAVALRRFGVTRFREDTTHSIQEVWEVIALSCNSLLFLLVGLSVSTGALFNQIGPIFIAILLVLSARALSVYGLLPLGVQWFKLPHISLGERHIMWWGGLKGGLAIAVVLSIPSDLPERQLLFEITLGVVLFTLLVSAPSIRPLMHFLGLSEISRGEGLEYRNSLLGAETTAEHYLGTLASSKLLPKKAVDPLADTMQRTFSSQLADGGADAHSDDAYFAEFRAYRSERETLQALYQNGLISQYIYLDMSNRLHTVQESLRLGEQRIGSGPQVEQASLFQRLEDVVLGKIREKHWLAGMLSKYQEIRMVQRVQRNLAHILCSDQVIAMLKQQDDLLEESRDRVIAAYTERKKYYRRQLKQMKFYYPEFYPQYVQRLATRSMIHSGMNRIKSEFDHGHLGAKGFNLILERVKTVLNEVESSPLEFAESFGTITELLKNTTLFGDLQLRDYELLEKHAAIVTYLAGDTIMDRFETGEDFYILVDGTATRWMRDAMNREHCMAVFREGDFMGEATVLERQHLHRHKRLATIRAATPCTLIRISPEQMSTVLWHNPNILKQVREVHEQRISDKPKSTDKLRVYIPQKPARQKKS